MPSDEWEIFVISLSDALDRRAPLLAQLQALGLRHTVVNALDGRRGLPPIAEPMVDRAAAARRKGRPLSDGELACGLSHQMVYRTMLDRSLPGAIVFEDDAILTPHFEQFLQARGHRTSDLVQMDHQDARIWRGRHRRLTPAISVARLAENASLASGYALTARAARYILDHSMPLGGLADWPCDVMALAPVVTIPRIVDHPPISVGSSSLEAGRLALRAPQERSRGKRFAKAGYWQRWWLKRRTRKIS